MIGDPEVKRQIREAAEAEERQNYLGGRMASLYETLELPDLFGVVAAFALVAALVLAVLIKPIDLGHPRGV